MSVYSLLRTKGPQSLPARCSVVSTSPHSLASACLCVNRQQIRNSFCIILLAPMATILSEANLLKVLPSSFLEKTNSVCGLLQSLIRLS